MSKTLDKLKAENPDKIDSYWIEDNDGRDYWIKLKSGWITCDEVHTIHEYTVKACVDKFKTLRKCVCEECTDKLKGR